MATKVTAEIVPRRRVGRAMGRSGSGGAHEVADWTGRRLPRADLTGGDLRGLAPAPDGFVFRAEGGSRIDPDKVRKRLERDVLEPLAARFPPTGGADEPSFRDGVPHSFRHYFVSAAANRGVPERVVQDWLGHKESRMIAWYYHLHSEQSKEQMRKMRQVAGSDGAAWRRSIPLVNQGNTPGPDNGPKRM